MFAEDEYFGTGNITVTVMVTGPRFELPSPASTERRRSSKPLGWRRHRSKAMRFVCDEMLGALARWLRAAGYDTLLSEGGRGDRELVDLCASGGRVLLTKDRQLAGIAREFVPVLLLPAPSLDENARELREVLGVSWQHDPFTRCLVDNALLTSAKPGDAERLPPTSRRVGDPLRICPTCGRLYWPGGHVRRMQHRLAQWQGRRGGAGEG